MNPSFSSVKIKCNPLVKTFLENNFGSPINIPDRHILQKHACSQLFKSNPRPLGGYGFTKKEYTEVIDLNISYNNFRYDGYEISDINTRNFNEAVRSYIKDLSRTNLDSLMISAAKQENWKEKFLNLVQTIKGPGKASSEMAETIRTLKRELDEHEINIKQAIDYVIIKTLKLNYDIISYEMVKKDYYRYRNPEQYEKEKEKKYKKVETQLSSELNLFSDFDNTIN